MKQILPLTDIFVPSLEELLRILQPQKYNELLSLSETHNILDVTSLEMIRELGKKVISLGVKVLMIKLGHRGVYLLTGDVSSLNSKEGLSVNSKEWANREIWCNAYKADSHRLMNSSGAGDTSVAAFLSAILLGENPELSVKYAAVAGRNNLYCTNIFDELPVWNAMTKEIKNTENELIVIS